MQAPEVEHKTITSFDGTPIVYQVRGDGPAVVLANGLGGTFSTWRHQYALLGRRYRVISWDYRGLFRSGRPARLDTLALRHQTRDLEVVLAAEGVERAVFFGWSMGVQYNFEYYRSHADQFAGIVALNGVAGRPFDTAFDLPMVQSLIRTVVLFLKHGSGLVSGGTQLAARWSGLVPTLQRLGVVASTLDTDVFHDLAREYSALDFEAYGETLRHLGQHDASDLLHRIHVPALVVTGTKDLFTPLATAQAMARTMPDARLAVIEGGTHYAAVEFPRQVNEQIRDYLKRIDYGSIP
jgi:pimeloyl-ACP methyl ester carboxylesterase